MSNQENPTGHVNKAIEVDPPAAHVCEECGHIEKVETIMLVSRQADRCDNCGSKRLLVNEWERVKDDV
jgi:Zn finger protein HypA/HybF involved in hydrogenase expression